MLLIKIEDHIKNELNDLTYKWKRLVFASSVEPKIVKGLSKFDKIFNLKLDP